MFCIVSTLVLIVGCIAQAMSSAVMGLEYRISSTVIALASSVGLVIVYLSGLCDMVLAITD